MNNERTQAYSDSLSEKEYRALLTAVGQTALVSVTDAKGDILFANDKFVEVSQYSIEELIGQNHRILKSGHQPQALFDDLWKTISSGNVWRGEIQNRAKDGSYYWVDTSISPIMGADGKPERYVAARFLINDKKEFEQKLQQQNNELANTNKATLNVLEDLEQERNKLEEQAKKTHRFQQAVDGATDAIIMTTPDMKIIYVNRAWQKLTGYTEQEALGKTPRVLKSGKTPERVYKELFLSLEHGQAFYSEEFVNKKKNGDEYDAALSVFPILEEDSVKFFVGVQQDITKRREVDKAKTEFVSLASHQLRTPLSAIRWYSEVLLSDNAENLSAEQKEYLAEIQRGNLRMIDLVNALLNVSRLDLGTLTLELEDVDIILLAKEVVHGLESRIVERSINFKTQYSVDTLHVRLDKKLMHMVIENLCSNAVKYTPAGGEVSVHVYTRETMLRIEVADTGMGIPKSQQDKIFSKLFRADNVRKSDTDGTGLGLYIVKSIIEYTGGRVWFESEESKGTTFYVELPLSGMQKKVGTVTPNA